MATAKKAGARKPVTMKKAATRPAAKPPARPPAKPRSATRARKAPAPTAHAPIPPAAPPAAKARDDKPKKPKLVRDSFTIPKAEYTVLEDLKQRAAKAGAPAKKSEILRAGIKVLAALGDHAFLTAMASVPAIKTGRPSKG